MIIIKAELEWSAYLSNLIKETHRLSTKLGQPIHLILPRIEIGGRFVKDYPIFVDGEIKIDDHLSALTILGIDVKGYIDITKNDGKIGAM